MSKFISDLAGVRVKVVVTIIMLLSGVLLQVSRAGATAEFSESTGLACSSCHVNQMGGGELTGLGRAYMDEVIKGGPGGDVSTVRRVVRLSVGYLHILAGVIWFGTIFYVHILLRPSYAAKGLPRGELMLGWTCIIVVAVTGTLLTVARMSSIEAFYRTSFGVLLSIKILLFMAMASTAAVVTFVIGPKLRGKKEAALKEQGVLTPDEISAFDGRDGGRAYVAVDGVVYDVTGSALWKGGKHMRHLAGSDMSSAIKQAPHGHEKLDAMPVVGSLSAERPKAPAGGATRAFYIMAYMNLVPVFLIIGIIAIWRWW